MSDLDHEVLGWHFGNVSIDSCLLYTPIGEASADDGLNAGEIDSVFGGKVARFGFDGFHTGI